MKTTDGTPLLVGALLAHLGQQRASIPFAEIVAAEGVRVWIDELGDCLVIERLVSTPEG